MPKESIVEQKVYKFMILKWQKHGKGLPTQPFLSLALQFAGNRDDFEHFQHIGYTLFSVCLFYGFIIYLGIQHLYIINTLA